MSISGPEYPIAIITPFTAMQAAEFEQEDFGSLSVQCGDVAYTDFASGLVLLRISCGNAKSARDFLKATRQAARDVLLRRAAFRSVADTGRDLRRALPPRLRPAVRRARAKA